MWQSGSHSSNWRERLKPYVKAILTWGAIGVGIIVLASIVLNITGLDKEWLKIDLWERVQKIFKPMIEKFEKWWGGSQQTTTPPTSDFDLFKI